MLAHRGFELLDEGECRRLLGLNEIGRVSLSIGALPAIFPVNYMIDRDSSVFRTATGTQLAEATGRGVVAFESGYIHPSGESGWSVMVVGVPIEVTDAATRSRLSLGQPTHWTFSEEDRLFRLATDLVSGTRIYRDHGGSRRHAA
jgi:nitroimidazol reductase NimA-like FMN-containing flavoprotein (pyridoxamine 5'-phosphate oxidase superfamily)